MNKMDVVLEVLSNGDTWTVTDIAEITGISRSWVVTLMHSLVKDSKVHKINFTARTHGYAIA